MANDLSLKADLDLSADQTLADVPGREVAGVEVEADAGQTVDGVQFGVQAGTQVTLRVFNSADDEDPAGVLGIPDPAGSEETLELAPQIELDPSFAWISYAFQIQIKATVGKSLRQMGFSLEGEKSLLHLNYRRHPRDANVVEAVAGDLLPPRVIARWPDIAALEPGDGLAYQLRGSLSLGLSLSASDLVTGTVGSFGHWVHTDVPIGFDVSSGASISADISWTDDFTLAITRVSDGRLRLGIHKTKARTLGVSAKLGVTVELQNSDTLEALLRGVFDRLIGETALEVDQLLESTISELRANESKWRRLLRIAGRLGFSTHQLEQTSDDLKAVVEAWQGFKKKVDDGIRKALRSKIDAAFTYDYQRIHESSAVLQAVVSDDVLSNWHQDLLRAQLGTTIDWLREHPDSVERFLRQDRIERSHAWGFSLSLGSSLKLSSRSTKRLEKTVRTDLEGRRQVAFVGDRAYEGRFAADSVAWRVDFKAQMPEYSRQGPPHGADATEAELGLAVSWNRERNNLEDIGGLLDQGVLWGFFDEDDVRDIAEELRAAVGEGREKKGFVAEIGLQLDHEGFLRAADAVTASAEDLLPSALAGALPYWDEFEARTVAKRRIRLYGSLWRSFLSQDELLRRNMTRSQLGSQAQSVLRRLDGGKKIAGQEAALAERNNLTYAAQAKNHPSVTEDWADFTDAMTRISQIFSVHNTTRRESVEIYGDLFQSLQKFWDQALYVRALGRLLAETVPLNQLMPSFWVEIEGEDQRRIYIGSKQTA